MINKEAKEILEKSKSFGFEEINGVVTLIGKTPHIAPEAWFHQIYNGIGSSELATLSNTLFAKIPDTYSKFLEKRNGMNLFSSSLSLYGYRKNYARTGIDIFQPFDLLILNNLERLADAKDHFFFFGSYNWDGSKVYMDDSEKIYRCSNASSNPLNVWTSFEIFLNEEIIRLDKHYQDGVEIDEDDPTTPPR